MLWGVTRPHGRRQAAEELGFRSVIENPVLDGQGSVDLWLERPGQTGNWVEFGDSARKLKWVDQLVDTIREDSYNKNPDAPSALNDSPAPGQLNHQPVLPERVDANGQRYVLLPRLDPVDFYYLYNPDNYYRLTP